MEKLKAAASAIFTGVTCLLGVYMIAARVWSFATYDEAKEKAEEKERIAARYWKTGPSAEQKRQAMERWQERTGPSPEQRAAFREKVLGNDTKSNAVH